MSTGRIEYARVERILDHPLAAVWAFVGRFDGVDAWIDGVAECRVTGAGVGAVRAVTRNGSSVRERLDRLDPEAHESAYRILDPHPLPASDVRGLIALAPEGEARTRIVWRSEARDFRVSKAELGAAIARFYAASIDRLAARLAEIGDG
jgi:uncharacterized protein YndB with AHSA1/START domain